MQKAERLSITEVISRLQHRHITCAWMRWTRKGDCCHLFFNMYARYHAILVLQDSRLPVRFDDEADALDTWAQIQWCAREWPVVEERPRMVERPPLEQRVRGQPGRSVPAWLGSVPWWKGER